MNHTPSRMLILVIIAVFSLSEVALARQNHQRTTRPNTPSNDRNGNINDANYAYESGDFSEQQKKQQKGVKVLEQADSLNQEPLKLIR